MANKQNYVDFGLACGNVFKALDRGLKGRRLDELSPSVLEAIGELTTYVYTAMRAPSVSLTKLTQDFGRDPEGDRRAW